MAAQAAIVNVVKTACSRHHTPERREFKVLGAKQTFENIESMFLCHPGSVSEISMSTTENGPWTSLKEDDLYDCPVLSVIAKFPNYAYFRIRYIKKSVLNFFHKMPDTVLPHPLHASMLYF